MPLRFAISFLSSALDVRRSAFLNDYVVVASLFPSRGAPRCFYTSHSLHVPCSCAIASLNITEIYEQTCFGNGRDRHDRARCRETTFRKGRSCARGGSQSSQ